MTTRDKRDRKRPASARASTASRTAPVEPTEASAAHEEPTQQRRLENECTQFLRVQQKLAGRKTTAEYARMRLVHRPDDDARRRSLHQNGAKTARDRHQSTSTSTLGDKGHAGDDNERPSALRTIRPHTARAAHPATTTAATRVRPQSARPERRNPTSDLADTTVAGQRVSVALLEKCYYNPVPLTSHLSASRSAPRLQAALQYSSTKHPPRGDCKQDDAKGEVTSVDTVDSSGRRRIVVNMRHLEVREWEDDDEDHGIMVRAPSAPLPGQRHDRSSRTL